MLRHISVAMFMLVAIAPFGRAQDTTFPTDDEVRLLVTQTERAVSQYKPLLDEEAVQLGKAGEEAVAKDRDVVHGLELAIKALKINPQGFNGPGGFTFFEWLDDASRNALLCSSTSMNSLSQQVVAGNTQNEVQLMHLSETCMDVSTLLYTVSENAGSLYARYVKAEEALAQKGSKVAKDCTEALKRKSK